MLMFVDVESTGLFEAEGRLLEVALVLTDDNLTEVAHTSTVIRPVGINIDALPLDDVVRKMHTANGLLDELRAPGVPRRYEAEALLVERVKKAFEGVPDVATEKCVHCGKKESEHDRVDVLVLCPHQGDLSLNVNKEVFSPKLVPALSVTPLAGSSVGFDKRWLRHHMPDLEKLFSYRVVDVSSIGELAARWAPEVYASRPRSTEQHRALADARGSIALLRYYREQGFIIPMRGGYLTPVQIAAFRSAHHSGNSERVAVDTDWHEEGGSLRCWARFERDTDTTAICLIPVKHTGTPHRFCMRAPHEGYCDDRCFQERCP